MGSGGGGWSDMEVEEMPSPGDGRNDATKETPKFVSRTQSMAASLVSELGLRAQHRSRMAQFLEASVQAAQAAQEPTSP